MEKESTEVNQTQTESDERMFEPVIPGLLYRTAEGLIAKSDVKAYGIWGNSEKHILSALDVKGNRQLRKTVVCEAPDLAYRLLMLSGCKNKRLARVFIARYKGTERNHQAYFVSQQIGRPIKRTSDTTFEFSDGMPTGNHGTVFYGNPKRDSEWRNDNVWGNGIRALENACNER